MNNNDGNKLDNLANICQLASFAMIFKETSNEELMQELRLQDRILMNQTNDYLKVILDKITNIEKFLEKEGYNYGKEK